MGVKPNARTARLGNTDRRQTVCSICGCGIFEDQPREWSRQPLGLVHPWCIPAEAVTHG